MNLLFAEFMADSSIITTTLLPQLLSTFITNGCVLYSKLQHPPSDHLGDGRRNSFLRLGQGCNSKPMAQWPQCHSLSAFNCLPIPTLFGLTLLLTLEGELKYYFLNPPDWVGFPNFSFS
jgi:hypothetical protein